MGNYRNRDCKIKQIRRVKNFSTTQVTILNAPNTDKNTNDAVVAADSNSMFGHPTESEAILPVRVLVKAPISKCASTNYNYQNYY